MTECYIGISVLLRVMDHVQDVQVAGDRGWSVARLGFPGHQCNNLPSSRSEMPDLAPSQFWRVSFKANWRPTLLTDSPWNLGTRGMWRVARKTAMPPHQSLALSACSLFQPLPQACLLRKGWEVLSSNFSEFYTGAALCQLITASIHMPQESKPQRGEIELGLLWTPWESESWKTPRSVQWL